MKPSKSSLWSTVLLLCVTLSIASFQVANAEILYKWREADGSLTFSPKPPPEGSGIAYELVTSGANSANISSVSPITSSSAARTLNNTPSPSTTANTNAPAVSVSPSGQQRLAPAQRKSEHCNDLKNRVMSLERLLRTELSAETMDNAVVQMARYQTGINRACR